MKQYLIMCDEMSMARLQSVYGSVFQFLEVQGMELKDHNVNALVSPKLPVLPTHQEPGNVAIPSEVVVA